MRGVFGPKFTRRKKAHTGGGFVVSSAGAGQCDGQGAVGAQSKGCQGAAGAGKPAPLPRGIRQEGRRESRSFSCKFFKVETMQEEITELKNETQRLQDEIAELKRISEPGEDYFHNNGFTLVIDLA
eukprot:3729928-Pleurochrysis_carterae.AAC.3